MNSVPPLAESTPPGTDDELVSRSLRLAAELMGRAGELTVGSERRRRASLRRLLSAEGGPRLVFALADRVLRPTDAATAAGQLAAIAGGPLPGIGRPDRGLLRLAGAAGRVLPAPVVAAVNARLRHETRALVYPSEPPASLGRRLARLWAAERRPNLNLLGEAVLGWGEAARRLDALEGLLRRPDVDCVSVKISSIAARLSLVDFAGSVARVAEPLARLYRLAQASDPPKLVNLDMEEHRDLDLTVEVFTTVLDRPEFLGLSAGLALQAYLPDTHGALDRVLSWAAERRRGGGAPVRVRLVKGANLAMERVEAELRGWPAAPYPSKAETDASYKRLLERLVEGAATGVVRVGVASHNLFDIALALVLAEEAGATVEVEMLAGMADAEARAVAERAGRVLFYVPITSRRDFRNSLAYLARRLDENATPEGFLRQSLDLEAGGPAWDEQAARFVDALGRRGALPTRPRQHQDRSVADRPGPPPDGWWNEPDTDLTVPANRAWALGALAGGSPPSPPAATEAEVEAAVARAAEAATAWSGTHPAERAALLEEAAAVLAAHRAEAVAVMADEAKKTFAEADTEVSEAVDYARWYGAAARSLIPLADEVASEPLGVVVVSPPWNFPYAIPAGGVLAALAAGNTVLLKPSPETPATAGLLVELLGRAGLGGGRLQLVAAPDDGAGRLLVTHPRVDGVILTGSIETARRFSSWRPERRLLAETSGKNALVVGATADVDQAVADLVHSAFSHGGQKCSAASLAIVHRSIHDDSPFLRQLADATSSLRVGPATDPATEVGPIVGPMTEALHRALTRLDAGESWLLAPELVDPEARLWRPGIRVGVQPGSWAHLTEWFGPVLGVMRAENLEDAVALQNAVAYGLTAGLHSLDPAEHERWAEAVEAGNLYINRPTTGAIVGRQPFGGWKASSVGPTAKAGGPNYLIGLRRWHDAEPVGLEAAARSYQEWWDRYFSRAEDLAGLRAEANVLRYRPFAPGVVLRLAGDATDEEALKAAAAAEVCDCPLAVSMPGPRPALATLERRGAKVTVESAEALAARLADCRTYRLRLLGTVEAPVRAAAAEQAMTVLDEPVCSHGRIELLRWLREQSVSRSRHRYGTVVYR